MARTISRDLAKASEHLGYEINMLMSIANVLGNPGSYLPAKPDGVRNLFSNSLVQSFAVHTRNLIDFFYAQNPQSDDMVAEHFVVGTGRWCANRPKQSACLRRARIKANKEISHLTYERLNVTPAGKPWDTATIRGELVKVMEAFFPRMKREAVGGSFRAAVEDHFGKGLLP